MVNGVDLFFIIAVLFVGFLIGCVGMMVVWLMEHSIEEKEEEKDDEQRYKL